MSKEDNSPSKPNWVPDWGPHPDSLSYIGNGLTAVLLILVTGYLIYHFTHGGKVGGAATIAAGVGVGGAGT